MSTDNSEPHGSRIATKVILRLARNFLRKEYNTKILSAARRFSPDLLLTVKGVMVDRATLRELRNQGLPLYQYYPDNSLFAHWSVDPGSMEEYDCCFFTKKFLAADAARTLTLRDAVYLPHGYDPEIHRTPFLSEADKRVYAAEVAVIAVHTQGKEEFLDRLLQARPDLPLKIWGSGWTERCRSERVKAKAVGAPLFGQAYVKALAAAKINLALLSERANGASQADLTTTRTFEIPACGGFMLHQRTPDVLEFYNEGSEIECFESPEEALKKIEYYLARPTEREAIARQGHARAVPGYSYDERMRVIMDYHTAHNRNAVSAMTAESHA